MVETGGLENRFARKGNGGSNPSPSAMTFAGFVEMASGPAFQQAFARRDEGGRGGVAANPAEMTIPRANQEDGGGRLVAQEVLEDERLAGRPLAEDDEIEGVAADEGVCHLRIAGEDAVAGPLKDLPPRLDQGFIVSHRENPRAWAHTVPFWKRSTVANADHMRL